MIASMSWRLPASNACCVSSTRSGVVDSSPITSPFLGEAFGGSTSLVDVHVVGLPLDQAFPPNRHARKTESDLGAAAPNTASCDDHGEGHPEAEIKDLLGFGAELLVRRTYVFQY